VSPSCSKLSRAMSFTSLLPYRVAGVAAPLSPPPSS
jgi:hypothetical protein